MDILNVSKSHLIMLHSQVCLLNVLYAIYGVHMLQNMSSLTIQVAFL